MLVTSNPTRYAEISGLAICPRGEGTDANPETRLGQRIQPQPNGCWLFDGKASEYGRFYVGRGQVLAHRFVYETLVGPIPKDRELHHLCKNPGCCNPAHLVAVTDAEHARAHRARH